MSEDRDGLRAADVEKRLAPLETRKKNKGWTLMHDGTVAHLSLGPRATSERACREAKGRAPPTTAEKAWPGSSNPALGEGIGRSSHHPGLVLSSIRLSCTLKNKEMWHFLMPLSGMWVILPVM